MHVTRLTVNSQECYLYNDYTTRWPSDVCSLGLLLSLPWWPSLSLRYLLLNCRRHINAWYTVCSTAVTLAEPFVHVLHCGMCTAARYCTVVTVLCSPDVHTNIVRLVVLMFSIYSACTVYAIDSTHTWYRHDITCAHHLRRSRLLHLLSLIWPCRCSCWSEKQSLSVIAGVAVASPSVIFVIVVIISSTVDIVITATTFPQVYKSPISPL